MINERSDGDKRASVPAVRNLRKCVLNASSGTRSEVLYEATRMFWIDDLPVSIASCRHESMKPALSITTRASNLRVWKHIKSDKTH